MNTELILRELICKAGKKMVECELTHGINGNISARLDGNYILVTPTTSDLGDLKPEDIVKVDMKGNVVGDGKPTSELFMHINTYKNRTDVWGCIHAHALYSTAYSVAGISLDKMYLPEIALNLGRIPVIDYKPPHSADLATVVGESMKDNNAVLMSNHGSMVVGKTLLHALYMTENMEFMCKIDYLTRVLGNANEINVTEKG